MPSQQWKGMAWQGEDASCIMHNTCIRWIGKGVLESTVLEFATNP